VILIVYYIAFMIAASLADYLIGLIVERDTSLIVFLALYGLSLWLAWRFAVWMTQPKNVASS
jgi:hypothetical protein